MIHKTILILAFSLGPNQVWAEYSRELLHRMVAAGDYPAQGPIIDWERRDIPFEACKPEAEEIIAQFKDQFPVEVIYDDHRLYMAKAWTADGITSVTCSLSDMGLTAVRYEYN